MGKQIQVSVFSNEIGTEFALLAQELCKFPVFPPKMGRNRRTDRFPPDCQHSQPPFRELAVFGRLEKAPPFPPLSSHVNSVCSTQAVSQGAIQAELARKSPDAIFGLTLAAFTMHG
jgi:hypothetical protein